MMNLGDFRVGATVEFKWNAFSGLGGSITRQTNGSIRIYKGHSATERSSAAGITDTEDFDSLTGLNHVQIDLSDNTDSGFYAAGSEYQVVLQGAVIDGQTINAVLAHFSIERDSVVLAAIAVLNNLSAGQVRTELTTELGRIDATISSRLATSGYTAPPSAASIRAEMDSNSVDLDAIGALATSINNKTTNLPAAPAAVGDIPTANQNADALLDRSNGIEVGATPRGALRLILAMLVGKVSGARTGTETFRNAVADSKSRVVVTADDDGNRTAVTTDQT